MKIGGIGDKVAEARQELQAQREDN
jgi:hypothetical protein